LSVTLTTNSRTLSDNFKESLQFPVYVYSLFSYTVLQLTALQCGYGKYVQGI